MMRQVDAAGEKPDYCRHKKARTQSCGRALNKLTGMKGLVAAFSFHIAEEAEEHFLPGLFPPRYGL